MPEGPCSRESGPVTRVPAPAAVPRVRTRATAAPRPAATIRVLRLICFSFREVMQGRWATCGHASALRTSGPSAALAPLARRWHGLRLIACLSGPVVFHVGGGLLGGGGVEEAGDDGEGHVDAGGDATGRHDAAAVDVLDSLDDLDCRVERPQLVVGAVVGRGRPLVEFA